MSVVDIDINRNVRRIFVRHWIDLGRISLHSINGNVTIRGTVKVLPGIPTPLTAKTMENIAVELRRIPNVRFIRYTFTNWTCIKGGWECTQPDETDRTALNLKPKASTHTTL
jgi:hypothetical protein